MVSPKKKSPNVLLHPVPIEQVRIADAFWSPRQALMARISLPKQHSMLETYHHVDNFRVAAGEKASAFVGMFYYDSDLYKWIEAATYALHLFENKELESQVENVVSIVLKAQQPDGYINTFFTTNFPEQRMKHFYVLHELYCIGHLIEAAVASFELAGKRDLLDAAIKSADFLIKHDPAGQNMSFIPGHQEIELALVRLYRCTGEMKYLDFATTFINKRGKNPRLTRTALENTKAIAMLLKRQDASLGKWEREHGTIERPSTTRTWEAAPISVMDTLRFVASFLNGYFVQQHVPVRDQHEPVGHAVRATYMYAAMADIVAERADPALFAALDNAWHSMVQRRMYLTGGIGSLPMIEGFGRDHELKNEKAYCETCAAIGSFLWSWRMLQLTGAAEHADLMERVLYNAILPGWSIDGTRYRYTNPLASRKGSSRQEWFSCACCPPNIGRIIGSLGQYIASTNGADTVTIHQYIGSEIDVLLAHDATFSLKMTSELPWGNVVKIVMKNPPQAPMKLQLRIPSWAIETTISINDGTPATIEDWDAFHVLERTWKAGDEVTLSFAMTPEYVFPDPRVKDNRGRVAIKRGPLIYCIEGAGNPSYKYDQGEIDITSKLESRLEPGMLGGIAVVEGKMRESTLKGIQKFTAIPYFAWGNREKGPMQVWLKVLN
jgi:DUF1680 family protein